LEHQPWKDILQTNLSEDYRLSYQLLYEWWTGQYQDPVFSQSKRLKETVLAGINLEDETGTTKAKEEREFLLSHLRLRLSPISILTGAMESSEPHAALSSLFHDEFALEMGYEITNELNYEVVVACRRKDIKKCPLHAYRQQVAWIVYRSR
jgi:hypothetical protein